MSDLPPMSLQQVQNIFDDNSVTKTQEDSDSQTLVEDIKSKKNHASSARTQAIFDVALSLGVKAGLAHQLNNINNSIKSYERDLDTVYDFSNLMIQDRVVPPVISEARDLYNQDGDFSLRLSGAYYKIVSQAKFSSVSPSWRDYLNFPNSGFNASLLNTALMPKNSEEKKIWRMAVDDGWKQGVEQANLILKSNMDRMNRDLTGMILFHKFVLEGKITMPIIASADLPVNLDSNAMSVDETLLRITSLPEFNSKISTWKSTVSSQPFTSNKTAMIRSSLN
ncbi:TPA: type IV secretory system conjugative DNA transfer family protein [Yersinia enterocolitica]|nr:type IV secretory system conjugative DNA transfer family protein [Yersinia enterocolitica]